MTTLKTSLSKTASLTTKHLDVRLRKIRSLKTSALKPLKIVSAAKILDPRPSIKLVVPYGLIVASLVLSGVTASEAHAAVAHKPAHVVTHVARRHAVPAQQIDPVAQFFQGLFGGAPVKVSRGSAAGSAARSDWVDVPSPDNSAAANTDAQAASDAAVRDIQQMDDQNALNASMQAAEQQNEAAQAAAIQAEQN